MKHLKAMIAAIIIAALVVCGLLAIGLNAVTNQNSVPINDAPPSSNLLTPIYLANPACLSRAARIPFPVNFRGQCQGKENRV